jgi:hypothetical protein
MTYDEKLDLILAKLAALEAVFATHVNLPVAVPTQAGGLYDFVRPGPGEPRYGLGVEMGEPDAFEAKKRSMHAVNWRGGQTRSTDEDAVWAEIDKLKAGKPEDVEDYALLDPEFVGFALLTNLFQPRSLRSPFIPWEPKYWAGSTIQSFMDEQFAVTGGPGDGTNG